MTDWEPRIVSFLCNWCSYGAADLAGVSRMSYPANLRVIRIPPPAELRPAPAPLAPDDHPWEGYEWPDQSGQLERAPKKKPQA